MATTKLIKVQASPAEQETRRVILFERHPDHPNGELFISGNDTVHTVAPTKAVLDKIHTGQLVEIGKPKAEKAAE